MSHDTYTDRLSEYLDGDLDGAALEAMRTHVAECGECAGILEELRGVVEMARSLPEHEPPAGLWGAIAADIGAAPAVREKQVIDISSRRAAPRRFSFSIPQLAAAAVVLVAISSASVMLVMRAVPGTGPVAPPTANRDAEASVMAVNLTAAAAYDQAVEDLEGVLRDNRGRLDPVTVAALEENLRIIDRAIADARHALRQDPASEYLNNYLADRMQYKLSLLRDAADIVRAET